MMDVTVSEDSAAVISNDENFEKASLAGLALLEVTARIG